MTVQQLKIVGDNLTLAPPDSVADLAKWQGGAIETQPAQALHHQLLAAGILGSHGFPSDQVTAELERFFHSNTRAQL